MKVVIIEGPDNTGKTTVIHELMEKYDNIYYIHAIKPKETDPIKCALEQENSFKEMIENIKSISQLRSKVQLVILDRSWVGEYVYGCLYRGNGDDFVKDMIKDCYVNLSRISAGLAGLNFSTILYTASPKFCARNDDGKSISEGNTDAIKNEVERFEEIIKSDCVIGKKGIINVENDGKFLPKDDILKMTLDIIDDYRENFAKPDMLYIQGVRKEMLAPDYVPEDVTAENNGQETEEGRTAE